MDHRVYNKLYYVTLQDTTNRISLAQTEVQDIKNENKSCERLVKMFFLENCIVTTDALNTQRPLAELIIKQEGDYCMAITESTIVKFKTKRENEVRFFISSVSFDTSDIAKIGYRAIRSYWGIENSLHWIVDMDYGQDLAQMKNRDFIKNRLVLNKLSLNIVRIA